MSLIAIRRLQPNGHSFSDRQPTAVGKYSGTGDELTGRYRTDPNIAFRPESIELFNFLKQNSPSEWQRLRGKLKNANTKLKIGQIDKAMKFDDDDQQQSSLADKLIQIALKNCELFHDESDCCYASFVKNGHRESWPVNSEGFRSWLSWRCFLEENKSPRKSTIDDALLMVNSHALHEGSQKETFMRVGKEGESYYIDLVDEQWRVIEITAMGWSVLDTSPLIFLRNRNMRALPCPDLSGDLEALWQFANIPDEDRILVLTWMLESYRLDTPYQLLELVGEQGSAKSSTQSVLRDLIDPNLVNLRCAPSRDDDIDIAAINNHLVSFENLSKLSASQQDTLCSVATGGGRGRRKLFTDGDEVLFKFLRPVVVNGISGVVIAPDLLSRSINITMPQVIYQDAVKLKTLFTNAKPQILGGLMDLFVDALALLPEVDIPPEKRPRMADMARLGEATARSLGHKPFHFLDVYTLNQSISVQRTIDSSPVASATLAFLNKWPKGYKGLTGELFERLSDYKSDDCRNWPRTAKGFADAMRRIAPALRIMDVEVSMNAGRSNRGITCSISRKEKVAEPDLSCNSEADQPFSKSH